MTSSGDRKSMPNGPWPSPSAVLKKIGAILLLIGGILAVVGMFIPIGTITISYFSLPVTLVYSFLFVDPFLMLIGGILALALHE